MAVGGQTCPQQEVQVQSGRGGGMLRSVLQVKSPPPEGQLVLLFPSGESGGTKSDLDHQELLS